MHTNLTTFSYSIYTKITIIVKNDCKSRCLLNESSSTFYWINDVSKTKITTILTFLYAFRMKWGTTMEILFIMDTKNKAVIGYLTIINDHEIHKYTTVPFLSNSNILKTSLSMLTCSVLTNIWLNIELLLRVIAFQ